MIWLRGEPMAGDVLGVSYVSVRATGYLSPPGGFGHENAYPREFLVMTMQQLPE